MAKRIRDLTPEVLRRALVPLGPLPQRTSEEFTASGDGLVMDLGLNACRDWSVCVVENGTVTSWDVRFEYSLDAVNWTEISDLTHTRAITGDGVVKGTTPAYPATHFRPRVDELTLGGGTNITVYILGMP